ncbi:hypothetical protein [Micromonospora sicca]|uniref:hypothetical protein n=1 Tax=Micromonospora sicca TaxID=2202420 RepID=UPI0011B7B010|nr:hypothetical protein [Micromonospora sp. 4G51]
MTLPGPVPWMPTSRDTSRLISRLERLELKRVDQSVSDTGLHLRDLLRNASTMTIRLNDGVRVRKEFVCLREPMTNGSDRGVPPPHARPPSTRLMGRKGVALRLMLTALFEAQTRTEPGERPAGNPRPLSHAGRDGVAWTDLLATDADDAGNSRTMITRQDKQRRHLGNGLEALERACLVALPHRGEPRNIHREFMLLEETAAPTPKPPYSVPKNSDDSFVVPTALFTNGWISVLSDAELAFLLMTMLMYHPDEEEGVAVPAKARLQLMGIGPETYEAHRLLETFGLVRVTRQAGRAANGRVASVGTEGGRRALPDLVQLLPEGLKRDGYSTVADKLDSFFCR